MGTFLISSLPSTFSLLRLRSEIRNVPIIRIALKVTQRVTL